MWHDPTNNQGPPAVTDAGEINGGRILVAEQAADYDSPWKEALQHFFSDLVAFFLPQAHADINWNRGHVFLDKELQQLVGDAVVGPRRADLLVKVWRRGGEEAWVLVHLEVQAQPQRDFAERMYVYNYRLYDRYVAMGRPNAQRYP
jgi:hypothetical protein